MKKYLLIASAFIAIAAVSSCTDTREGEFAGEPGLINISATVGQYTKATDTAFEQGDRIGLYAGSPLNFVNIPLEFKNNAFSGEEPLHWVAGQTEKTVFRAYYPYFQEIESQPEELAFMVKHNQSSHADFTASDLMFATAEAAPSDESVKLAFNHLMSKLVVQIDNQSGDPVKEIIIIGPVCGSMVNRNTGAVGAAVNNPDEDVMFRPLVEQTAAQMQCSLILPPQICGVGIAIVTEAGRTVGFVARRAEFVSGKSLVGSIVLKEIPVGEEVELTLSQKDWEEGGSFRFSDKELGQRTGWSICYYSSPEYPLTQIRMEEKAAGAFYGRIEDYRSDYSGYMNGYGLLADYFFFISDNDRYIFATPLQLPQSLGNVKQWPVSNGGRFILDYYEGPLGVWFYPDEGVMEFEAINPKWQKLGTGEFVNAFYRWGAEYAKAYDVQIYEDKDRPGVYMVENPFEYWEFQNDYHGPAEMIIDASNPDKVILRPLTFMPEWKYVELFYTGSPENRSKNGTSYGTLKDGVIRFNTLNGYSKEDGNLVYNGSACQIVLPGYDREPVVGFNYYDMDRWELVDGVQNAVFEVHPWLDVVNIRYMLYPGVIDYNTLQSDIRSAITAGEGTRVDFRPGEAFNLLIPIPKSGAYTLVFYGDCPSAGKSVFYYTTHIFELPDGSLPEASIKLSEAKPYQLFQDKAATVHLDFANGTNYRVRAVSSAAAAAAGLTEEDYLDYAMAGYALSSQASFFNGIDGKDIAIVGLEPETEYLVIAAGQDVFGRRVCDFTTVTTGASPQGWISAGTGTWNDEVTFLSDNPYSAQVQILRDEGSNRYRVVQPYASYWNSGANPESYTGSSTDFEFCVKEVGGVSYIYYLPFRTGFKYNAIASEGTQNGWVTLMHYDLAVSDPSKHVWTAGNVAISDGVYNIAPYGLVTGTTGYFNFMTDRGKLTLTMPGKTPAGVGTARSNAPAFVNAADDMQTPAVIFGEHTVNFK